MSLSALDARFQRIFPLILRQCGEEIVYHGAGGDTTILAIVVRDSLDVEGTSRERIEYPVEIVVNQRDIPAVRAGLDSVTVRRRYDDAAPSRLRVAQILQQSGGTWRLRLT